MNITFAFQLSSYRTFVVLPVASPPGAGAPQRPVFFCLPEGEARQRFYPVGPRSIFPPPVGVLFSLLFVSEYLSAPLLLICLPAYFPFLLLVCLLLYFFFCCCFGVFFVFFASFIFFSLVFFGLMPVSSSSSSCCFVRAAVISFPPRHVCCSSFSPADLASVTVYRLPIRLPAKSALTWPVA